MRNPKIKNATVVTVDGVTFRSKLEARFAQLLRLHKIPYKYEEETWVILDKFEYEGEKIRAVTYTPDFILGDLVVEIKGWQNDVFPLKRKFILRHLLDTHSRYKFRLVKTVKDMMNVIGEYKQLTNK